MVYIPVELTESLKKGECVLFVGAGLSKGLPQWKELVEPLADELGVSMDKDPRIIASWYENEFGRSELEEKIVSQLNKDIPLPKMPGSPAVPGPNTLWSCTPKKMMGLPRTRLPLALS